MVHIFLCSRLDDQLVIMSSSKAFNYFRTRLDGIRCVFDPPQLVNKITVEDRVRGSFCHIFFGRNITKFRHQLGVWSKELSKYFSKFVISVHVTLCNFSVHLQTASTSEDTDVLKHPLHQDVEVKRIKSVSYATKIYFLVLCMIVATQLHIYRDERTWHLWGVGQF